MSPLRCFVLISATMAWVICDLQLNKFVIVEHGFNAWLGFLSVIGVGARWTRDGGTHWSIEDEHVIDVRSSVNALCLLLCLRFFVLSWCRVEQCPETMSALVLVHLWSLWLLIVVCAGRCLSVVFSVRRAQCSIVFVAFMGGVGGLWACVRTVRLRSGWGSDGNVYNVLRGLRDFWKPSGA